jgi:hypothetical protein
MASEVIGMGSVTNIYGDLVNNIVQDITSPEETARAMIALTGVMKSVANRNDIFQVYPNDDESNPWIKKFRDRLILESKENLLGHLNSISEDTLGKIKKLLGENPDYPWYSYNDPEYTDAPLGFLESTDAFPFLSKNDEASAVCRHEKGDVKLFGIFHTTQPTKDTIEGALGGVILPSLFTKTFGRGMMMTRHIPEVAGQHVTSQLATQFVLNNLIYAAPAIGAIAFFVRSAYVLYQERKKGAAWSNALKTAGVEGVKTGTKFFLVYMAWTAAVLAAASLGILSGGMLPLGVLFVGLMVAIGFSIASFITDKLPAIIANWETVSMIEKAKETLVSCMLPGLFEGSVWTLMDNPIVNIAGHVAHFGGQALDALAVSAAVAAAFLIGVVIFSAIKSWWSKKQEIKKNPTRPSELPQDVKSVSCSNDEMPEDDLWSTLKLA